MNTISSELLKQANEEAIYNIYLYLSHKTSPLENESFSSIVYELSTARKLSGMDNWKARDVKQLTILKNAIKHNSVLADSTINNLTRSKSGLTACSFTKPTGKVSVIFKGTGSGEWIDNGEGLSGVPQENTYISYDENNNVAYSEIVKKDFATEQQVEALNWFRSIFVKNNWNKSTHITVSGHSKGGNKAQFVAINSDLVNNCFSFAGQGFSPEAITAFKNLYGDEFDSRRKKIISISSENDYVNVLGNRLALKNNIYYFKSRSGLHFLESIIDSNGFFLPQAEQGRLSEYVESVSNDLMHIRPFVRQYATLGVMNVFQKYIGDGLPVNGDALSTEKTVAGVGIAVGTILRKIHKLYDF